MKNSQLDINYMPNFQKLVLHTNTAVVSATYMTASYVPVVLAGNVWNRRLLGSMEWEYSSGGSGFSSGLLHWLEGLLFPEFQRNTLPSSSRVKEYQYFKVTSGFNNPDTTQQTKSSTETCGKQKTHNTTLVYCTVAWKACQKTSKRHLKRVWYSYNKLSKPTANNDLLSEETFRQHIHVYCNWVRFLHCLQYILLNFCHSLPSRVTCC